MDTQNHTTNPTGIKEIPRSCVEAKFERNASGVIDRLSIDKLDLSKLNLPSDAQIKVIAKAHYTEEIFDAGAVAIRKAIKNEPIGQLDSSSPLHLRVIVFDNADKRIVASCERLNAIDTDQEASLSLLPVEPVELGEQLWRVQTPDDDSRPVLLVNSDPRFNMLELIKSDLFTQALVLPEAIKRVLEHLFHNEPDDDDPIRWQNRWYHFLKGLGIEFEAGDQDSVRLSDSWLNSSVQTVAAHLKLVTKVLAAMPESES